jgi:3-oxoadipate enol-lactonase
VLTGHGVLHRAGGARIPWEMHGDAAGPRLVFGHGLTARGLGGAPLYAPLLDAGWTVLTMDQRGHGEASPVQGDGFDVETLGDDIVALLDEVGWERAWLGGGSMGAATGMAAAAAAPQRVDGLLLMAPAVGTAPNPALQRFARLGDAFAAGGIEGGLEAYAAMLRGVGATDDAIAQRAALIRMQPATSWAAVLRGMAGWEFSRELTVLAGLDVPSVVIAWAGDDVHPLAVAEEFTARLRNARLHVLGEVLPDPGDLFRIARTMVEEVSAARPR